MNKFLEVQVADGKQEYLGLLAIVVSADMSAPL